MQLQQLLREENYHLKNEITQLKNAFDLNRDILKMLNKHDHQNDPHHQLFLQIITKLTSVSNQAMLNALELLQEKNTLKQEIYRLNVELDRLEARFNYELENNKRISSPTEAKLLLHDQFANVNRELLAFQEEKISHEQEVQHWKQRLNVEILQFQKKEGEYTRIERQPLEKKCRIKRKYTSNEGIKSDWKLHQLQRQNKRLREYIEQVQNRLLIFIKAYHLQEQIPKEKEERGILSPWSRELQQIKLIKYALNDITIKKREDDLYMTITHRFRQKIDPAFRKERRVYSWPKYKQFKYEIESEENLTHFVWKTLNTNDSKEMI